MDPNVALATIRDRAGRFNRAHRGSAEEREAVLELVEAIDNLDEWLSKGGFAPAAWVAEPVWVDNLALNASVGVNNVEDHLLLTIVGRDIKLTAKQGAFLHRELGRRLRFVVDGLVDPT